MSVFDVVLYILAAIGLLAIVASGCLAIIVHVYFSEDNDSDYALPPAKRAP